MNDSNITDLTINFKEVCYTCPYRETYLNENNMYGDNRIMVTITNIGCNHEKVCKDYLDSEE